MSPTKVQNGVWLPFLLHIDSLAVFGRARLSGALDLALSRSAKEGALGDGLNGEANVREIRHRSRYSGCLSFRLREVEISAFWSAVLVTHQFDVR